MNEALAPLQLLEPHGPPLLQGPHSRLLLQGQGRVHTLCRLRSSGLLGARVAFPVRAIKLYWKRKVRLSPAHPGGGVGAHQKDLSLWQPITAQEMGMSYLVLR